MTPKPFQKDSIMKFLKILIKQNFTLTDGLTKCDRICEKVPFSHTKFDPIFEL